MSLFRAFHVDPDTLTPVKGSHGYGDDSKPGLVWRWKVLREEDQDDDANERLSEDWTRGQDCILCRSII